MKTDKAISYNLVITTIILIFIAVFFKFSLLYSFIIAIIYSLIILSLNKYDSFDILKSSMRELFQYKSLYVTILLIGATVSIWLSSGTIATMIYYGFNYISGVNFVLFAFITVSICSYFMGTALGTFSTIGLILYSIGKVANIPEELLVGAIISGAFISDKIAPISGLVNINLKVTETNYKQCLKHSLLTLLPTVILTAIIYFILGQKYIVYGSQTDTLSQVQQQLGSSFTISPILFIFPVIILVLSMIGINALYTIISGIILGTFFSFFIQKQSLYNIFSHLIFGYKTTDSELGSILSGGGMKNMLEVVVVVITIVLLIGIFNKANIIDNLLGDFVNSITTPNQLLFKTGVLSSVVTIVSCDQTLGLILPVKLLKEKYDTFKIKRENLFRIISDTGVIVAPLFPWNLNYIIISGIVGNIFYFPYACLCYIAPLVSFVFGEIYVRNIIKNKSSI